MDEIDKLILKELSENARITASDIAPKIDLSIQSVNKRIAKLKESGQIKKYTIKTESKLVGKPLTAFLFVFLEDFRSEQDFLEYIKNEPDFIECFTISGEYDYLIKVVASSIEAYDEKVHTMKFKYGIVKSATHFCTREIFDKVSVLP